MLFLNLVFSIITMTAMILISPLLFVVIKSSNSPTVNPSVKSKVEPSSKYMDHIIWSWLELDIQTYINGTCGWFSISEKVTSITEDENEENFDFRRRKRGSRISRVAGTSVQAVGKSVRFVVLSPFHLVKAISKPLTGSSKWFFYKDSPTFPL